ncbi:MAG: peptidoglycan DD-metalloendopeptidase family protein [bacterium]|nr:peptidoglycan DD-metalloendopeptidase family protein [bacterium]
MPTSTSSKRAPSRSWRKWVYVPLFLVVAALHITERRLAAYAESPYPIFPTVPFAAVQSMMERGAVEPYLLLYPFESGETLSDALTGVGLARSEVVEVVDELSPWADPRKIRPADQYSASFAEDGSVELFELWMARKGRVRVARSGDGWQGDWHPFERSVKVRSIEGTLEGALETAIASAGGEINLAILMADVFQWDLDFTRDLRTGDRFRILYETVYLDGVADGLGSILGVSYENGGRLLEAYRFGDDGAYYDADGRPLKKMFLRSPLRYSRVTSRFSRKRFHPILKRYRPHYGVDYGARIGTPVRATANGTVVSAGWDRGGGKTVKIRHPNSYLTAYLHLSGYAKRIRSGRRVMQGDVIGYVGSTGLSTAPHLDYRVQRHGRWIDPLSLKSVPADPVPHRRLPEFLAWRDELRLSMNEGKTFEPSRLAEVAQLADAGSSSSSSSSVGTK